MLLDLLTKREHLFQQWFHKLSEKPKSIVIFPSGVVGLAHLKTMESLGFHVDFFCDNAKEKQHCWVSGVPVISFDELKKW